MSPGGTGAPTTGKVTGTGHDESSAFTAIAARIVAKSQD
jgi:hypothetical protein